MSQTEAVTYVKLGRDGDVIEREALTPADHVQFKGTGWVLKDSKIGKSLANPKKSDADAADGLTSTAVTAHAAAAQAASSTSTSGGKSTK